MLPRLAIILLCALWCNVKGEDSYYEYYQDEAYYDEGYRNKIVGGLVVDISKAPYQVSLESKIKGKYRHLCGATIISKKWVITSAQCVIGDWEEMFRIRAGTTFKENGGTLHNIKQYKIHNDYAMDKTDFDVALMQVSEPFQYSEKVKAIPLATEEPVSGQKAWVSGWDHICYGSNRSTQLKMVGLKILSRETCNAIYHGEVTARMLCALQPEGGKDTCMANSGGAMVVNNKLAGIGSWGRFGAENPSVYTNVKVFKGWIEKSIGEDSYYEYYQDEAYYDEGYRNKIVGGLVVDISKAPYQVN